MATIPEVLREVGAEVARAMDLHPSYHSLHEAHAVLLEEVDELWDQVRRRQSRRDMVAVRTEAIQVAAVAVRLVLDLCDTDAVEADIEARR